MAFAGRAGSAGGRAVMDFAAAPVASPPDSCTLADDDLAGPCPELACVRHLLPAEVLAAAQERAAAVGVGADRVLIAAGAIGEEDYLRALGERLGVGFEPLDDLPRRLCPLEDERLLEAAHTGLLPVSEGDDLTLVIAPRGTAARRILQLIESNALLARRIRFTSAERFNRFVLRYGGAALAARATDRLRQQWPALSAAPPRRRASMALAVLALALLAGALMLTPAAARQGPAMLLAGLFLAWLGLRLAAAFVRPSVAAELPALPAHELPVYSIIAPLYREAASVGGLLSAIERLDYPREKLDVIVAVEADDRETRAAIEARRTRLPITLVTVPGAGPRTKPKALNVALPFARGTFTVIYDAEDRPERQQLRQALQAFAVGGDRLACVQAPLCIDNTADSWLARSFTAEYAGQFDVFLPALAAWQLPLPLGGSSNHFHTDTLREIGAWDPYNVTEDADLGMRLARFGYRTGTIAATTYEEAPAQALPWLRQRTRWFKGWTRPVKSISSLYFTMGYIYEARRLVCGRNTVATIFVVAFDNLGPPINAVIGSYCLKLDQS
jgi:glycosyltransferase involved in cell wall biosynthesis